MQEDLRRFTIATSKRLGWSLFGLVLAIALQTTSLADDKTAADKAVSDKAGAEKAGEKQAVSVDHLAELLDGAAPKNADDLKAIQKHLQKLVKSVRPSTVGVRVGQAQGSGVIISEDGYVLTAAHVVGRPNQKVTFILNDGRTVQGITLGMNRSVDAGLMKITDAGKWPKVEMNSSSKLKKGQWCLVMGHPGGYQKDRKPVVRFGRVLSVDDAVVKTDCALVGGDSGGPLFDMDGKVVGINSRIGGPLTANLHVNINVFPDAWERLVAAESWGHYPGQRPFIGVMGDLDADNVRISSVVSGAPAEKAGILPGDVITKFDGKEITDFDSLISQVNDSQPGDSVKVEIMRDGQTIELELTVGGRSGNR